MQRRVDKGVSGLARGRRIEGAGNVAIEQSLFLWLEAGDGLTDLAIEIDEEQILAALPVGPFLVTGPIGDKSTFVAAEALHVLHIQRKDDGERREVASQAIERNGTAAKRRRDRCCQRALHRGSGIGSFALVEPRDGRIAGAAGTRCFLDRDGLDRSRIVDSRGLRRLPRLFQNEERACKPDREQAGCGQHQPGRQP